MKITNKTGLPQAIVSALQNDSYSRGRSDYTVTELIDSPRRAVLLRQHGDELEMDAADGLHALWGQAVHAVLERSGEAAAEAFALAEERLYVELDGALIGGQVDTLSIVDDQKHGRILSDFKLVRVWEVVNGPKPEKHAQLNILGWLARKNGFRVDRLEAVMMMRDWSVRERRRKQDYPPHPIIRFFIPMWTDEKVEGYVRERLAAHRAARVALPECTDEERWYQGTRYALRKERNKRAERVLDSVELVMEYARNKGLTEEGEDGSITLTKGYTIDTRHGEHVRCQDYCQAAPVCAQWAAIREAEQGE